MNRHKYLQNQKMNFPLEEETKHKNLDTVSSSDESRSEAD